MNDDLLSMKKYTKEEMKQFYIGTETTIWSHRLPFFTHLRWTLFGLPKSIKLKKGMSEEEVWKEINEKLKNIKF